MPIKPENAKLYPKRWKSIRAEIMARAESRCECDGLCGLHRGRRCCEIHGQPATWARGKIVLTIAHLDHKPRNSRRSNLRAMCQRCHLRYDAKHHAENSSRTRDAKRGQARLEFVK